MNQVNEITLTHDMNSQAYWNYRFCTDWDANSGREQGRFFSRLALNNLPEWLVYAIKNHQMSVCDWGCAEGDGTDILAQFLSGALLAGVDFSEEAIRRAKAQYPNVKFLCEDFLASETETETETEFDVIFSSNTLEHFRDPWWVFAKVSERARRFAIVLLPFREYDRIDEHFATFDFGNIPQVNENWVLVHSAVIDAAVESPTYWAGEQVLLVFARQEKLRDLGLVLSDLTIHSNTTLPSEREHKLGTEISECESKIKLLTIDVNSRDSDILKLNQTIRERDETIGKLQQVLHDKNDQVRTLEQFLSERDIDLSEATSNLDSIKRLNAEMEMELRRLKEHLSLLQMELASVKEKFLVFRNSRGWKFATALHKVRIALVPEHMYGLKRLYRGLRTVTGRISTGNIKKFLVCSMTEGPRVAVRRTRAYLSAMEGSHAPNRNLQTSDIHRSDPAAELRAYLRERSYQGVFVMGSCCMGWHEVFKQRHHHIADYLMENGFLVLCAMNPIYQEDFTEYLKRDRIKENLFLVNFDDRVIWLQVVDLLSIESRAPLFYHLVGTEPGTTLEDIGKLKKRGYTFVYDYLDEISREINPALLDLCLTRHEYLLEDEDALVITSADNLYDKASTRRSKNFICTPNGVKLEDWILEDDPWVPPEMTPLVQQGKPIIGYYGSFAPWMNYEFIQALSRCRPDLNIVMIGYDYEWGKGAFAQSRIAELPNVHIIPAQKYHNLKYFSRFFAVGIIPFRNYEITKSVSPVKMFEYMAQRIPVVASGMQECRKYRSCLNAENAEDFVLKVEQALQLKDDPEYLAQLRKDAEDNTWGSRGKEIQAALMEAAVKPSGKLLSIVVPTYNMEKLLPRCLDSMLPPSLLSRLEVIVVNDGSKDNSRSVAQEYEQRYPGTVQVVNKENGGHGSCINVGIRVARGGYFKIVDADDWLNPLDLVMHANTLENTICDMVVTNYRKVFDHGGEEIMSYSDRLQEGVYQADRFFESLMTDTSCFSYAHMHAITYRTDLLKRNNIKITEKLFYVDQEYISLPLLSVKTVEFENNTLYRYYYGRPGQSVAPDVARRRAPDNYRILRNIIAYHESLPEGSVIRKYVLNIIYHQTWFFLSHSDDKSMRQEILEWWRRQSQVLTEQLEKNHVG